MVNRDPQGLHAHTISNPHFNEGSPSKQPVKTVSATVKPIPPLVVRSTSPVARTTSPTGRSNVVKTTPLGRSTSPEVRSTSPSIKSSTSSIRSMSPTVRSQSPSKNSSLRRSKPPLPTPIDVHKANGGTQLTGQPYMMGTKQQSGPNGVASPTSNAVPKKSIFDFNNKMIKAKPIRSRSKSPIGRSSSRARIADGKSPKSVRKSGSRDEVNAFVPFDPTRTPLRSSLRKPKQTPVVPSTPDSVTTVDSTDGAPTEEGGIPNPAFAQSSPVLKKKKVRIHTQSTAV